MTGTYHISMKQSFISNFYLYCLLFVFDSDFAFFSSDIGDRTWNNTINI